MPGLASRTTTLSQEEVKNIILERRSGFWQTKATLDECHLSLDQMEMTDYAITANHRLGHFGVLDKQELSLQTKIWKAARAVSHRYNIKPYEYNGKTYWMFVIQPPDLKNDGHFCPLALACGVMVSGYTYITPSKAVAEWVSKQLGC